LQHWDGTGWSVAKSPNTSPSQSNNLSGITCTSATNCWAVGQHSEGNRNQTLILRYAPTLTSTSVVSRKTHGNAGTFDVDLTSGNGIECRSGGASGNYALVFTFANPLSSVGGAKVTGGTGTVGNGAIASDTHQYIVNLTGVTNAQTVTVNLSSVADSAGNFSGTISGSMNVLVGDTNADRFTDAVDVSQTKSQSGTAITNSNFREDVNADGFIDAIDVSLVKSKSGTALP
jgi:hypothetical protein